MIFNDNEDARDEIREKLKKARVLDCIEQMDMRERFDALELRCKELSELANHWMIKYNNLKASLSPNAVEKERNNA